MAVTVYTPAETTVTLLVLKVALLLAQKKLSDPYVYVVEASRSMVGVVHVML